jgi:hypothetical protein
MQYEISSKGLIVTVKFEGTLKAIDLIFLNQDQKYRQALSNTRHLFLDFSQIVGSQLTNEDIQGLVLLSRRDAEKVTDINLVILVGYAEPESVGLLFKKIFSESSWQVTVVQTHAEALKLLQT